MIRVIEMSGTLYGVEMDLSDVKEIEEIENFIEEGYSVMLFPDKESMDDVLEDVEMVER